MLRRRRLHLAGTVAALGEERGSEQYGERGDANETEGAKDHGRDSAKTLTGGKGCQRRGRNAFRPPVASIRPADVRRDVTRVEIFELCVQRRTEGCELT